jgi:hypothetical protein
MKYAVEMGSDAIIYIPSVIKTVSGIQKLMGWAWGGIHSMVISQTYFYLLKIRKSAEKQCPEVGNILYFRTYPSKIERKV